MPIFSILLVPIVLSTNTAACAAEASTRLHINRKQRMLYVVGADNKVLYQSPVGVGRGGLKGKRSIKDLVTPTGFFVVDLVLMQSAPESNKVSSKYFQRYSKTVSKKYFSSPQALAGLFKNMNSIDFDGNGKPDRAYGSAYFGVSSPRAVTGPKLSSYKGTQYWYSIALHGTPNEKSDIGSANSGGCVHLPAKAINDLTSNRWLKLGTELTISDGAHKGL